MAAADGDLITYHRRSDRTPEKNADSWPIEDKKLIFKTRSESERVRKKMMQLQDEVEDREKEVEKERSLRKAAEERLQRYLVDLYGNDQVNDELRQRLPRAGKVDPLKEARRTAAAEEEEKEEQEQKEEETEVETAAWTAPALHRVPDGETLPLSPRRVRITEPTAEELRDLEVQILPSETEDSGEKRGGRKRTADERKMEGEDGGVRLNNQTVPPRLPWGPFSGHRPFLPSYYPPAPLAYTPNPLHYTPNPLNYPPNPLNFTPNPLYSGSGSLPPSDSSLPSSSWGPGTFASASASSLGGSGALPEEEGATRTSESGVQSSIPPSSSTLPDGAASCSASSLPPIGSLSSFRSLPGAVGGHPYSLGGYGYPPGGGLGVTSTPADPLRGLGHARQVSVLLAELDSQKEVNEKLAEKLANAEREVEALKIALETKNVEGSHEVPEKAAALIEEIVRAQKTRDAALAARLRATGQENQELWQRTRTLERRLESLLANDDGSAELNGYRDKLSPSDLEVADAFPGEGAVEGEEEGLEGEGDAFLIRMSQTEARQRQMWAQELQVVLDQRDRALAQCDKLRQEVLSLQRQASEGGRDVMTKRMKVLQQERDRALASLAQLREEHEELKLSYSLLTALLGMDNIPQDQLRNRVETYADQAKDERGRTGGGGDSGATSRQLTAALEEQEVLRAELEKSQASMADKEKRIKELERLVSVLRKKLRKDEINEEQQA